MNRFAIPRLRVLLLAAIGAVLIGGSHGSDAWAWGETPRHETWNWNGTLAAGRHLEINGVNGEIVAVPGAGDRVIVTAEKTGSGVDVRVRTREMRTAGSLLMFFMVRQFYRNLPSRVVSPWGKRPPA